MAIAIGAQHCLFWSGPDLRDMQYYVAYVVLQLEGGGGGRLIRIHFNSVGRFHCLQSHIHTR